MNHMVLKTFKVYLLCEMAGTYSGIETGIGNNIFVKIEPVGGRHGPRIKVSNIRGKFSRSDYFVVTIAKYNPSVEGSGPQVINPRKYKVDVTNKELIRIKYWISSNFNILQKMSQYLETEYHQPVETPTGHVMLNFSQLEKYLRPIL